MCNSTASIFRKSTSISFASRNFNTMKMKYSLSGHSCVQKVYNMHKQIKEAMQVPEFDLPISSSRTLLKVNRN